MARNYYFARDLKLCVFAKSNAALHLVTSCDSKIRNRVAGPPTCTRPFPQGPESDQRYLASAGAALAFPLIILAQFGLVFLHLSFQVAERFFAARAHRGAFPGGA